MGQRENEAKFGILVEETTAFEWGERKSFSIVVLMSDAAVEVEAEVEAQEIISGNLAKFFFLSFFSPTRPRLCTAQNKFSKPCFSLIMPRIFLIH